MKPLLLAESAVALPERNTMSFIHLGWDFSNVIANNYGGNAVSAGFINVGNIVSSNQGSEVLVYQG